MLRTRPRLENIECRGLGRLVEPDSRLIAPRLTPWGKAVVYSDDRTVSISWARSACVGLHSVAVNYEGNRVSIGTRMGTRPAFLGRTGYVVLRMIVEHTVIRLREPLRGRCIEEMTVEDRAVTRTRWRGMSRIPGPARVAPSR